MKSAFLLLLIERPVAQADECFPPESDELFIVCEGETCFVECLDMNLVPPGGENIKCDLSTGQPTTPFPTHCQPSDCPNISPANNLVINCNAVGKRCDFSCSDNTYLIGPSVVYCNQPNDGTSDAEWSSNIPTCGPSELSTCQPLRSEFAQILCTDEQNLGSTCQFSCDDDRILKGSMFTECKYVSEELSWSLPTPDCQLINQPTIFSEPTTSTATPETIIPVVTVSVLTVQPDQSDDSCVSGDDTIWSIIRCNPAVVGIGVGVFFIILVIAIGVACCIRKRKQREDEKNAMDHLWETNPTIQRSLRGSSRGESTQDAIVHNNVRTFRENNISEPSGSFYRPNRQAAQYHSRYNQSPQAQANPYSQVQLNPETEPFIYDPSNGKDQMNYPISRGPSKNQNYQQYPAGRNNQQSASSSNQLSTFFVPQT